MILIIKIFFILCLLSSSSYAGTMQRCNDWSLGDAVTDVKLDCDFNNIINEGNALNNENTESGFFFIEVLGALPAAGNQGRVVFDTSVNLLYFDTGTSWVAVPAYSGTGVLGDILYSNGTTWSRLGKNN